MNMANQTLIFELSNKMYCYKVLGVLLYYLTLPAVI